MTRTLNSRERKALDALSFEHEKFLIPGELVGIGKKTLDGLVQLGLIEVGMSERYDLQGWRITDDGWRCMYGKTYSEIMGQPKGTQSHPLRVWRWPME